MIAILHSPLCPEQCPVLRHEKGTQTEKDGV
jgi:hypothetical protein